MGFQVRVNTDKIKKLSGILSEPMNKRTATLVGKELVKLVRGSALKGVSPIAGKGEYLAYRGEYRKRISAGKIPGKRLRPVNLKVTGDFLAALTHRIKGKRGDQRIILEFKDAKFDKYEKGHRKGHNGQAKRPLLPLGTENFSRKINDALLEIVIEKLTRRLNRVR